LEQALLVVAGTIVGAFLLHDSHRLLDHIVHVLRRQKLTFEPSQDPILQLSLWDANAVLTIIYSAIVTMTTAPGVAIESIEGGVAVVALEPPSEEIGLPCDSGTSL
jgi:hypothetical protein